MDYGSSGSASPNRPLGSAKTRRRFRRQCDSRDALGSDDVGLEAVLIRQQRHKPRCHSGQRQCKPKDHSGRVDF